MDVYMCMPLSLRPLQVYIYIYGCIYIYIYMDVYMCMLTSFRAKLVILQVFEISAYKFSGKTCNITSF